MIQLGKDLHGNLSSEHVRTTHPDGHVCRATETGGKWVYVGSALGTHVDYQARSLADNLASMLEKRGVRVGWHYAEDGVTNYYVWEKS